MQHGLFGSVDLIEVTLKTLLYLGLLLFVGSGVVSHYVGPELLNRQALALRVMFFLGVALLALASVAKGWVAARNFEIAALTYFLQTQQGNIILVRLVFLIGLLILGLKATRPPWLYPVLVTGLLSTVSLISHAGASRSWHILTDLLHLGAVTAWAGSLMVMAWCWEGNAREVQLRVIKRLSTLGFIAVGVLSVAGILLAVVRIGNVANLDSEYGFSLFRKLLFVLPVFVVAGVNRFVVLPRLLKGGPSTSMGHMLFLESWLVMMVLIFTGLLSSTSPPGYQASAFESNLSTVNIEETLGDKKAVGQIYTEAGLSYLVLRLTNLQGEVLLQGPVITITATNQEGKTTTTKDFPTGGARYSKALQLERGDWDIVIEWPEERLEYGLRVP